MDYEKIINDTKAAVTPLDEQAVGAARDYQVALVKPPGTMGQVEEIAIRLSGITGKLHNEVNKKRMIVLCADNGVCEEGVSVSPIEVTAAQAVNMTKYLTAMSALCHHFGDEVQVVDMGIATPYNCDKVLNRRIANGTKNLYKEPAMTREEAAKAIATGIELAKAAKDEGVELVGVGEMGIGNTTTTAAVLSALTGVDAATVTGKGAGLTSAALEKKVTVVDGAIKLHKPDPADPIDVISKVGGFDIAAMCGVFLGCAAYRVPVVIDGVISVVAALCAENLAPGAKDYFFPSHISKEPAYNIAIEELGLTPYLNLGMFLGEGSGAVLAFRIIEAACAMTNKMGTFESVGIDDEYLDVIK